MGSQRVGHSWVTFTFSGGLWYCCSLLCPSFSGSLLPSHFRLLIPFYYWWPISSVQSLSHVQLLWPHGLQHTRFPCPSPTPGACSNLCPSSQWCHLTVSSSAVPLSSSLQSLAVSGSFPVSQFFKSGGQSIGFSISPSNEYSGLISFRIGWLDLFAVQEILKSLLQHHSSKASILWHSIFFIVQLSHLYKTTGKTIALTRWQSNVFVVKITSLLFNILSRLVIAFLPRSKPLWISWLQSPLFSHLFDEARCHDLSFLNVEF